MSEQPYKTKEISYSNFKILLELKDNKKQGVNISNDDIENAYAFAKTAERSYPNLRLAAANIRSMAEDLIGMLLKAENVSDEQIREFSRGNQITLDDKFQYLKQKAKLPQTMIGFLYDIKNVGNSGTHYDSKDDLTDKNVRDALIKAQKLAYGFVRFYSNNSFSAFLEAEEFIFPNKEGKIVKKVRDNSYDKHKSQSENKSLKIEVKKSTQTKAQPKVEQVKSRLENAENSKIKLNQKDNLSIQKSKITDKANGSAIATIGPKISENKPIPPQQSKSIVQTDVGTNGMAEHNNDLYNKEKEALNCQLSEQLRDFLKTDPSGHGKYWVSCYEKAMHKAIKDGEYEQALEMLRDVYKRGVSVAAKAIDLISKDLDDQKKLKQTITQTSDDKGWVNDRIAYLNVYGSAKDFYQFGLELEKKHYYKDAICCYKKAGEMGYLFAKQAIVLAQQKLARHNTSSYGR